MIEHTWRILDKEYVYFIGIDCKKQMYLHSSVPCLHISCLGYCTVSFTYWYVFLSTSVFFQFVAYRQDPTGSVVTPVTSFTVLYDCRLSGLRLRWKDSLTNPATSLNSWREEWPLQMSLMDTSASRLWSVQLTDLSLKFAPLQLGAKVLCKNNGPLTDARPLYLILFFACWLLRLINPLGPC